MASNDFTDKFDDQMGGVVNLGHLLELLDHWQLGIEGEMPVKAPAGVVAIGDHHALVLQIVDAQVLENNEPFLGSVLHVQG